MSSLIEIEIDQRLDAANGPALERQLTDYVAQGARHLRLNMSRVEFMSSAGLRVLATVFRQLKDLGGSMQVVNAHPNAARVMELAGYGSLLQSDAPDEAVAATDIYETDSARLEVFPMAGHNYQVTPADGSPCVVDSRNEGFPLGFGVGQVAVESDGDLLPPGLFLRIGSLVFHQNSVMTSPDYLQASGLLKPEIRANDGLFMAGGPSIMMRAETQQGVEAIQLEDLLDALVSQHDGPAVLVAALRVTGLELICLRSHPQGGSHMIPAASLGAANGLQLLMVGLAADVRHLPEFLRPLAFLRSGTMAFAGGALLTHRAVFPHGPFEPALLLDRLLAVPMLSLSQLVGDAGAGLGLRLSGGVLWSGSI